MTASPQTKNARSEKRADLIFDDAAHEYRVDGIEIPGVTRVLEDVGIIDYSYLPDGVRMSSLERGRFVHQLCEFDDQQSLEEFSIDPRLSGYLAAWRMFRADTGLSVDRIEYRDYHSAHGYAGTLDRTGTFADGTKVLLDIKTTCVPWWARFQTSAYAAMLPSPASYRRMAVGLSSSGRYILREYRCSEQMEDFSVFLSALTVYRAKRSKHFR